MNMAKGRMTREECEEGEGEGRRAWKKSVEEEEKEENTKHMYISPSRAAWQPVTHTLSLCALLIERWRGEEGHGKRREGRRHRGAKKVRWRISAVAQSSMSLFVAKGVSTRYNRIIFSIISLSAVA